MLVLTRRINEDITIPGLEIKVKVVSIQSGKVRIGIEAPPHVTIMRGELTETPATPHVRRLRLTGRSRRVG